MMSLAFITSNEEHEKAMTSLYQMLFKDNTVGESKASAMLNKALEGLDITTVPIKETDSDRIEKEFHGIKYSIVPERGMAFVTAFNRPYRVIASLSKILDKENLSYEAKLTILDEGAKLWILENGHTAADFIDTATHMESLYDDEDEDDEEEDDNRYRSLTEDENYWDYLAARAALEPEPEEDEVEYVG